VPKIKIHKPKSNQQTPHPNKTYNMNKARLSHQIYTFIRFKIHIAVNHFTHVNANFDC